MTGPLILLSTITSLAYNIARRYYGDQHYAWCAPAPAPDRFARQNPPSSDPIALYWSLVKDIDGGDQHSDAIARNRLGIIRGANVRHLQGVIDDDTRQLIDDVAKTAPLDDFKPLLLIIPYLAVTGIVRAVDLGSRARATADEYIIEDLPRSCFDIIELERGRKWT